MVLGKITTSRHTNNPGGRHSIQTNQQSTSISPTIFTTDALNATTLPVYPGLGEAQEYVGLHIPCGLVAYPRALQRKSLKGSSNCGRVTTETKIAQKVTSISSSDYGHTGSDMLPS